MLFTKPIITGRVLKHLFVSIGLLGIFLYSDAQSPLVKAEYFFDQDPGFGSATSITVTSALNWDNIPVSINTQPLTTGMHQLNFRVQNQAGNWSITNRILIYKFPVSTADNRSIQRLEYFFDTDPGFGRGTSVQITAGQASINTLATISVSDLTSGVHQFYARVQDNMGNWSISQRTLLYKPSTTTATNAPASIVSGEYFFDTDPGFGHGTNIQITPGVQILDQSVQANISSVSPGVHQLFIRVKDANGNWSVTNRTLFYKPNNTITNQTLPNIMQAEYFVDTDPGFGRGTHFPITPGTQIINQAMEADLSAVSAGVHQLFIRVKDALGNWSVTNRTLFYKPNSGATNNTIPNIVQAEYFFDSDPGFGNGNNISITPGIQLLNQSVQANTAGLLPGIHQLYFRVKDATGKWSLSNRVVLYKSPSVSSSSLALVRAEYFIDSDPGFGKAIPCPIPGSNNWSDSLLLINVAGLTSGNHQLYVRVQDNRGVWSITNNTSFTLNSTPSPQQLTITGTNKRTLCSGDTLLVGYHTVGSFSAGNQFQLQLSTATSNFSNPITIGSISAQSSGLITAVIPSGLMNGSTYQIRLLSTMTNLISPVYAYELTASCISQDPPVIQLIQKQDLICANRSTGSIDIQVTGGNKPYIYSWTKSGSSSFTASTQDLDSLTYGEYNLVVKDSIGTEAEYSIFINSPTLLSANAQASTISCAGGSTGTVSVQVSGGLAPYQYAWNNGNTTASQSSLPSGNYWVTVTDQNGCIVSDTVQLLEPQGMQFQYVISNANCAGTPGGAALVNVSGGNQPYSYLWSNGSSTSSASSLLPGRYGIRVTDAIGCIKTDSITIGFNHPLPVVTISANGPLQFCQGGSVVLSSSALIGNLWSNGEVGRTTTVSFAGNYTVSIQQNGCTGISQPLTVTVIPETKGTFTSIDPILYGSTVPTLSTTALNGVTGTWNPSTISNTQSGNYTFTPNMGDCIVPTTISVAIVTAPDLAVQDVQSGLTIASPNDPVTLQWKVANLGSRNALKQWTEKIYLQSSTGENRILVTQQNFIQTDSLFIGSFINRSISFNLPPTLNVGANAQFVVEVVPGSGVSELSSSSLNNTGIENNSWIIRKLLTLELNNAQLLEGAAIGISATVYRTGSLTDTLWIQTQTNQSNRYQLPTDVLIPAGQSEKTFTIRATENILVEGSILDTLRVNANDFTSASKPFVCLDNDQPSLSISGLPASVMEGDSLVLTVQTNLAPQQPLSVYLTSSNQSRFPLPAMITIPAGSTQASTTIRLVQDNLPELSDNLLIQVGAAGHTATSANILIEDDDVPGLELIIDNHLVSEGAGVYATQATLRRIAGGNPIAFTANLSANVSNALILPSAISMNANENEKTFWIGTIENQLVDSIRSVLVQASIYVQSCGCNAQVGNAGFVNDTLFISDNDGPSLQLAANSLTLPEGSTNAGLLKITRNTSLTVPLTVNLVSSDTNELRLPVSVTIPIGARFIEVPMVTVSDGLVDGSKQVNLQANATGFAPGALWVVVTDQNKPDLQITSVILNTVQPIIGQLLPYRLNIRNTGFATAVPGLVVRGYWSEDNILQPGVDSVVIDKTWNQPIVSGQTIELVDVWNVPAQPQSGYLIFQVNPGLTMTELLYTNNQSNPLAIQILPNYTAQAAVDRPYYLKGDSVHITGSVQFAPGSPASNKPIDVYVITNGFRRVLTTTSNSAGQFTIDFVPLSQEAGHYTVGACYPGLNQSIAQDQFDILGVRMNQGNPIQLRAIVNDTLRGSIDIENLSGTTLTKFTLTPAANIPGVQFLIDSITVPANGTASLGYRIFGTSLSNGFNFEQLEFKSTAHQGNVHQQTIYYYCQAPNGYLTSDPSSIQVAVSQTLGQRTIEVRLINSGRGNTGSIQVNVPQVSWLSLISPAIIPSMLPGDTALVILKFTANQEVPFDFPIQGNIGINASNGNQFSIPFSFEKKAQTAGAVRLTISNQFTYLTNSAPLVKGAQVTIKNYFSGVVYAQGYSDSDGVFIAGNIPEGTHRVIVDKPNHLPFNGTLTILPGDTLKKDIFINYRAITFSWSVVPTALQDQYNITLVTTFETHVPMPVVTVDAPDSMPALAGDEIFAFNVVLTNHGLIKANDVQLKLPDTDQEYEFITNYVTGELQAQQSIQVPVIMRRRQDSSTARRGGPTVESVSQFLGMSRSAYANYTSRSLGCQEFIEAVYGYKCNLATGLWENTGTFFTYKERVCYSEGGSGTPPPPQPPGGGDGGSGGGSYTFCAVCPGISIGGAGTSPVYENENKSCNQCINDIIGAAANCSTGGASQLVGTASCLSGQAMEGGSWRYLKCIPMPLPPPVSCALAISDAIKTCSATNIGDIFTSRSSGTLGAQYTQISKNLDLAIKAYQIRERWAALYFGDMIYSNSWNVLSIYLESFIGEQDSIPVHYQDTIIQQMSGYEIQSATIQQFFNKWHTSLHAKSMGFLAPNAQYPAIINWNLVRAYSDSISAINDSAIALGYLSIDDMYQQQRNDLDAIIEAQNGQAVCASVKVQLSQQLTMTREAFEGTLEIFNGHPTDAMDSITVNISITDINGVPSNGLFEIQTGTLTNLSDVTGTGNISSQGTGKVKFLFIPEIGAAPTAPVLYNFGGSVRYWDPYVQEMVTMPLSNVPLTVNPSPNLALHYFMQRNILSDDALTSPEIEPTIPAELAVMVENNGYGPAVNVMIESAQPEIVENESGLAIQFQLIGSNFQGQPTQFGVNNILFGTIPAQEARVGQWYFTSTLLGKFIEYQSSVVHANSFGNPDLSLISGVTLHELTHSVKEYGSSADSIHDFLVNDLFDAQDRPDKIYFSQGKRTAEVYAAASGTFSSQVNGPTFTNTLLVRASDTGWNYIKLPDPGRGLYELVSVTRSDGQVIPLNNAWLTFVTLPVSRRPVYENNFHFVDEFSNNILPVSYTVVWKPKSLNGPKILRIEGIQQPVNAQPITQLTVVFDNPINPISFSAADLSLTFQGGPNLINSNNVSIGVIDSTRFVVNLSNLTNGNGFYNFTVQAAQIADLYGINGTSGRNVTWSQFLTVPTVESYQGLPTTRRDTGFNQVRVVFNLPIDSATTTADKFEIHQNGVVIPSNILVDSISPNRKTVYLSGLGSAMNQDGHYNLVVQLTEIQTTTQVFGLAYDSLSLQLDRTGPEILTMVPNPTGGIDGQHIPFVDLVFDENVIGFNTSSIQLTRNGEPINLTYTQLSFTDLKHWKVGNLGFATYPDGNYTMTIQYSGVKDDLGNDRSGVQQISWTVNRSSSLEITQLKVQPDRGYASNDGVTSTKALNLQFRLSDSVQSLIISQVDRSGRAVLRQFTRLDSGLHQYDLQLLSAGQTSIELKATDAAGNNKTALIQLFIDESPLDASWISSASLTGRYQAVDSLLIRFSDKPLDTIGMLNAIKLTRNDMLISRVGWQLTNLNDTTWMLSGLRLNEQRSGHYDISFDLTGFEKYQSGSSGAGSILLSWDLLSGNRAPVAYAGTDIQVTNPGNITLNASGSSDPDGDSITYRWIIPQGWTISDSTAVNPQLNILPEFNGNNYAILLVVNDGQTVSSDVVNVNVQFGSDVVYFTGLDSAYCVNNGSVNLIGYPSGGVFTGTGMNGNTFNSTTAGPGIHTITYTLNGVSYAQNVRVKSLIEPLFNPIASICSGTEVPSLPSTSINGINGSWSPATVSNTQSSTYVFTPVSGTCADTASLFVSVKQNSNSNETLTRCGSYIWNGQTLNQSGQYSVHLLNAAGCDSLVQLNLTIVQSVDSIQLASACDSFYWTRNGKWYKVNRIDTVKVGCVNHILQLTMLPKAQSSTSVTVCSSGLPYVWNSIPRTASGTYQYITTGSNGCDSIATLILSVTTTGNSIPAGITQTLISNQCGNRVYRYTASSVTNALDYRWTIPTSLGGVSGVTLDSGNIQTSRVIKLKFASNKAALNSDSIKVAAQFSCGYSNARAVKLNAIALNPPAAPISITITPVQSQVCGNRIYRYTAPILPVATFSNVAATGYQWNLVGVLSASASLDSGTWNSRVIRIRFTSNAASAIGDSIKVFYTSNCGNSLSKANRLTNTALNPPLAPSSIKITPIQTNVCGARIYRYAAPVLPNATSVNAQATGYTWSFTGALAQSMQIDSGSLESATLVVRFSSNLAAQTGDSVRIRFNSGCGSSPNRSLKLTNTLLSAPLAPVSILVKDITDQPCTKKYRFTAPPLTLASTTNGAANGYQWTLPTGPAGSTAVLDSGTLQSRIIVVIFSSTLLSTTDTIKVQYQSACGLSPSRALRLTNLNTPCMISLNPGRNISEPITKTELDISLFPNPTLDVFNWELKNESRGKKGNLIVYDIFGKLISTQVFETGIKYSIGSNWKAGLYFLQFNYADRVKQIKVVKQ